MKNNSAPDQRQQHGLAEVGLKDQRHDRRRKQQDRDPVGRHVAAFGAFGNRPGGEDDKGGFQEFRRLDAENPALARPSPRGRTAEPRKPAPSRRLDRQRRAPHHGAATGRTADSMSTTVGTRNSACRLTKWNGGRCSRSATGGLPPMTRTRPSTTRAPTPTSSQRSTVHHQSAIAERSAREII